MEERLDRAILAGLDRVQIIHGFGSGKIKEALDGLLQRTSVVKAAKQDINTPGATWVYL